MADEKKINVLIVVHDLRVGNGIAACLLNYYKYTVGNEIQIDFLLYREVASCYMDEAKALGSAIYILPHFTNRANRENNIFIKNVIKKGYDIVHVNTSGYYALSVLRTAKAQGVKSRIYHAHNPIQPKELEAKTRMKVQLRNLLYVKSSIKKANYYLACSEAAGVSAFGSKSFRILYNAIDTTKYKFDPKFRDEIRQELNIADKYVVGVVGRIEEQKNPEFIVRVFAEFVKSKPNSVLIWAGDGQRKTAVISVAQQLNIVDRVILLGTRKDVNKLYSAMDVLLLPSKYEGLGIVFIEAQTSGLLCFGSDQVPQEVEVTDLMHRLPIDKDEKWWARELLNSNEVNNRRSYFEIIGKSCFEIANVSDALRKFYIDIFNSEDI